MCLRGELLERQFAAAGHRLPAPVGELATALVAMSDGFVLQALLDPGRFSGESFASLLALLIRSLQALGDAPKPTQRSKERADG